MINKIGTMVIYETSDYGMFKHINGNRELSRANVDKLKQTINPKSGIYIPIYIDNNYFVIDGQHRLQACKELNIPIKFTILSTSEKNHEVMKDINYASQKWKPIDFVKYNANTLNMGCYKTLLDYITAFNTDLPVVQSLVGVNNRQIEAATDIPNINLLLGKRLLEKYSIVHALLKRNITGSRALARTLKALAKNDTFNFDTFVSSIEKYALDILGNSRISSEDGVQDAIIAIYNRGTRGANRIYL